MTNQTPGRRWTGRTRLFTTASILAVGIAGAVAVGANIGVLSAAGDNNDVGTLSAAGDLTPAEPQVVDVYVDTPAPNVVEEEVVTDESGDTTLETFTIDEAGTLSFAPTDAGLRLDSVEPAPGWSWVLTQSENALLTIQLTNGVRTFDVVATIGADGLVVLDVTEPIVAPGAPGGTGNGTSSGTGSGTGYGSSESEYDDEESEYDEPQYDDESEYENDDESHEGRDDDD